MKKYLIISCALGLVALLSCGTPGKEVPPKTEMATVRGDTLYAQVTLRNFYFDPSRIVTEVDHPLRLTLKKRSGFLELIPHDFNLIAPGAGLDVEHQKVPGGDGVTITLTPTEVGEFKFFCSKDKHAEKGMIGFLLVKENL